MTTVPLYHGIHTNAFGGGGRGFRTLFPSAGGPAADVERVGRWLQALRPEEQGFCRAGFAVNCFRVGNIIYAALARIEGGFARDEYGREGGLLVHALFAGLTEDCPPGHFGLALLDKARSFARPEVDDTERLDAYLEQCRKEETIEIGPVDPSALLDMDPVWMKRLFLALSLQPSPGTVELDIPVPEAELPEAIVRASSAFPPRLRLGFRWGTGIHPAPSVSFLVRPGRTPAGLGIGSTFAEGYVNWLIERLGSGRIADVRAIVESWAIQSWEGLLETISRN